MQQAGNARQYQLHQQEMIRLVCKSEKQIAESSLLIPADRKGDFCETVCQHT